MIVAVGTTRGPKVKATERALRTLRERFPGFLDDGVAIEMRDVPSGEAPTPRTTAELMRGARQRARSVFSLFEADGRRPALALGLEGGLLSEPAGGAYLESWAYATDGARGFFGSSGCIPMPDELAQAVLERGEDLGPAADRHYGLEDVRGGPGTFGVLTGNLVTREDAFVRALLHALAPFYNPSAY